MRHRCRRPDAMKEAGRQNPDHGAGLVGPEQRAEHADWVRTRRRLSASILPFDQVDVLGVNCAFGPYGVDGDMFAISARIGRGLVSALPNAGHADDGRWAKRISRWGRRISCEGDDAVRRRIRREHRRRMLWDDAGTSEDACARRWDNRAAQAAKSRRQAADFEPVCAPRISARTTAI